MAITMWMVVFINLLSGVTMWPLPSTSNLPVSMYDMCTKNDLHQIEDLKNTLIEGFNGSSINLDENGPSLSFGLLDEDWKRLLLLENRIPEESVLKSKLLVVFRILIAALYQAHGATLAYSGEQNITLTSDNEQNTIGDGERISSSKLDFGDFSSHDDGLDNSDIFDDDYSNESSGVSEFPPSIFTTSKYKPDPKAQTVTTFKTGDDANLDESSKNALLASTHITYAPTSNPRTYREPDETTMAATTVEMENKPNEKEDLIKLKDMPISPVMLNDYSEEETNTTTTEKFSLQQTHNRFGFEDTLTDDRTTSIATIVFTNPTIDITSPVNAITTTHIFPFDYEETIDTTNNFSDLTVSNLYPEMVELFLENEGINNQSHGIILPHNTHEDQLNVSSSNSGSWEDNQLFDDMVGSDSILNEVIVPKSTHETSKIHPRAFSTDRGTTVNESHEKEQSVTNESGYKNQSENIITNHDSLPLDNGANRIFNSGEMNQTTVYESTTEYIQSNDSKNDYEDTSRTNKHYSNINTYDTTSSIDNTSSLSLNNLRDGVTKNNATPASTLTSSDSNHLAPGNSFLDFWEHRTPSTDVVKESSATTTAGVSMSKPDSTMPSILEITQKDKATVDEHVSSEKGDDTQRYEHNTSGESTTLKTIIVERKYFSPTNDDDDDDDDVLYDATTSVQFIPESSEYISSAENDDVQSSGVERQVLSPTNNEDAITAVRYVPESSEPVYSVKNESVHSITSVKDETSSTHDDDELSTVQHVYKSPENVSSEKNEHSQSSSVEQTFVSPINNESQPFSESSEHVSSVENENFQIMTNENDDFSSTNDDHEVVAIGNIHENSEHVSSAEKENAQSTSIEREETSLTHENDEIFGTHHFPESSEHDANLEKENVEITSIEKDEISLTHEDDAVSALENIPESSEHVPSAEKENAQSTSIEREETSLTHEHDEIFGTHHFPESSEHDANLEKENVEITSIEKDEISLTHEDDAVSALENIPESSEHVSSAGKENAQSTSIEREETSSTHEHDEIFGTHHFPESSEHDANVEKENVQITSIEEDETSLTHHDDAVSALENIPESSEHVSSAEKENVQSTSIEKDETSLTHEHEEIFGIHHFPESSEHDENAQKENMQITSIEKDETSLTHEDDAVSVLENVPESSEHVFSLENESLSIGIKENDDLRKTHGDDASYVQEGSEHVSSVENEHFQRSHVEKTFVSPINDDESSTLIEPLSRSSEQETSTEIEKLQSSIIGKDKTRLTHDDDTIPAEQYVHESSEHVSIVEEEDSQISNAEQTDSVRKVTEPTGKVDNTVTDTDKGKESFRTFSVGFPKLSDNPLPTNSYNELKIYPKLSYTYQPSNIKLKISCQNGNDCVHVQHIEYMTSTDPLYKRLVKRGESKFESKTRDMSEINEDIPAHLISSLENLLWQEKIRELKESANE